MMGTHKGLVHVINLTSGVGFTLTNQHTILDVHCGGQWLTYTSSSSVGVYDFENEREILDYPVTSGRSARVVDQLSGSSNVLVSTSEELFILQIGWVRTTKQLLAKVTTEIYSLAVSFPLVAIANGGNATVLRLPDAKPIYQQKNTGKVTILWMTESRCALVAVSRFRILEVEWSEGECAVKEAQQCELAFEVVAVAAFQEQWLLFLSPDNTVRRVAVDGRVDFQEKVGMQGILASESTKENDAFYIVSQQEILKITTYSQTEKMNWYLDNGKYEDALVFGESVQYPREEIQSRILSDMVTKRQLSKAKDFLMSLLASKETSWDQVVKRYSSDPFLVSICTDIPAENISSEAAENILRKLVAEGKEEVILKCLETWPKKVVLKNELTKRDLMQSGMTMAKIEYALRQNLNATALQLLLSISSSRFFEVVEADLCASKDFLKSLSPRDFSDITKIDSDKAIRLFVENDWLDTDKVREQLPEDTVYDYLLELWQQKRRRNPGTDLVLLRLMLSRNSPYVLDLITTSTGLNRAHALDTCREFQHIEGQIVLLQVLNKTSELIEVLKGNFEQGLEYLRRRDNEELWAAVVSQGVTSESQAKMMIPFLTGYKRQVTAT